MASQHRDLTSDVDRAWTPKNENLKDPLTPENSQGSSPPPDEPYGKHQQDEGGCWGSFTGCCGGIWATRQMSNNKNREVFVRTTIRELLIYALFLVILCILTFGMTSATMYYYTKVLSDLFVESDNGRFRTANTMGDFWKFAEGPMLDGLYWEYWYAQDVAVSNISKEDSNILYENRLLGVPRLRQLRVKNDTCIIPPSFRGTVNTCYGTYTQYAEDTEEFGPAKDTNSECPPKEDRIKRHICTEWTHYTEKALKGSSHWGLMGTYSGGGYFKDLRKTKNESREIIADLKKNLWLDRGTRVVFLDFTVYNANINLFCVVKMVFEFPPSGGMMTSSTFRTVKLLRYVTAMDYFVLACEGIYCLFILYYLIEEIIEIKIGGCAYFKSMWSILDIIVLLFPPIGGVITSSTLHTVKLIRYVTPSDYFILACELAYILFIMYYLAEEIMEIKTIGSVRHLRDFFNALDIIVILISIVCIAFSVFRYILVGRTLKGLLDSPDEFANFEFLGFWQTQFNNVIALCVFFAWIKLFKYISFNKTMTQLSSTLSRCAKDVAGFAVMFFIVFFAFAQLGYLLFGTQVQGYSQFGNSVFTLLRTILGDFDFAQIEAANRVLGPIFFLAYVFFVFFVLLNMFLAIINDTYSEVKEEIAAQKNEFEIADYFRRGYNNLLGKMGKRDRLMDVQGALKLAAADNRITYEEIRHNLRKCNFSDVEIEMFMARYDMDGDKNLSEEETRRMLGDLEGQRLELERDITKETEAAKAGQIEGQPGQGMPIGNGVTYEEFAQLQRRVDRMETSIGAIIAKIDTVLVTMGHVESAKSKRRKHLGKMLDSFAEDE